MQILGLSGGENAARSTPAIDPEDLQPIVDRAMQESDIVVIDHVRPRHWCGLMLSYIQFEDSADGEDYTLEPKNSQILDLPGSN